MPLKEFVIASIGEGGRVGFRWRTEQEVIQGKGQFQCGVRACDHPGGDDLETFEVNFAYSEAGAKKNALVKVCLCQNCKPLLLGKKTKPAAAAPGSKRKGRRKRRRVAEPGQE